MFTRLIRDDIYAAMPSFLSLLSPLICHVAMGEFSRRDDALSGTVFMPPPTRLVRAMIAPLSSRHVISPGAHYAIPLPRRRCQLRQLSPARGVASPRGKPMSYFALLVCVLCLAPGDSLAMPDILLICVGDGVADGGI